MANEKLVMAVIRAARPSFRNNPDKVAFAVHASFLASDYVLTATCRPAFSETALSSSSNDEVGIENWNELEDEYAFVYTSPKLKKVLVKCLVMGDKLLVDALDDGGTEPVHLEININDYVQENGGNNFSEHYKNLEKLVNSLNEEIISKLNVFSKPASSSNPQSSEASNRSRSNTNEGGLRIGEPTGPQPYPLGFMVPPVNPIGGDDLFPGPGAGMYPTRGGFGGGSMLLGPNDPRWFGGGGVDRGFIQGGPPGVPPGARFDPYGPPGVPGFEPNRFVRNPRRPGGGTHPDLEHFRNDSDFI